MNGATRLFGTRAPGLREVETRSLHALAVLLLFVQLPHLTHMPLWVSALCAGIVALRLAALHRPGRAPFERLLSPLALSVIAALAAVAIRADYGYFVGRDPCVAFLSVLVAAKFAEVRRAGDTTTLLCLSAFLLLTQYFYSQTILSALVTLPAVLALGHALAVARDPASPAGTRQRIALVAKMLVQGVPLAALLFVVFPRLPGPLWSLPEDAQGTTGLSDSMEPGTIGSLSQSSAVAFRVEFDGAAGGGAADSGAIPPPQMRYWRGPVLSGFDGRRWTASPVLQWGRLPDAASGAGAVVDGSIGYSVLLQPHNRRWLFALEAPVSLPRGSDAPGAVSRPLARLSEDGQLLADEPVTQVLRYRQRSAPGGTLQSSRRPGADTLELAGRNPRSAALARRLHAEAGDDGAYAERLLARFGEAPFRYTLEPQLLGDAPVDEFLFDTREGFCEHYAAAFVVLMRAAGIPARVVTGYLGGEMNGDYMIVRQSDAHAWAEAWIDGAWQRFDPTGAVAPSRVETGLAAALPDSARVPRLARLDAGWLRSARLRWDALNHGWQRLVVDFDDDSQAELWERLGLPEPALWQLTVALLAVAGLWCLAVLGLPALPGWLAWLGWRQASPWPERAWARFVAALTRRGIGRRADESPDEYARRAAALWPDAGARIERLGAALGAARFARPGTQDAVRRRELDRELRALAIASWRGRRVAPPPASDGAASEGAATL